MRSPQPQKPLTEDARSWGYLLAGVQQVLVGGIGDRLLELHETGGQHHGHVALPGLTEHLEPAQHWEHIHQLLTPAQMGITISVEQCTGDMRGSILKSPRPQVQSPIAAPTHSAC